MPLPTHGTGFILTVSILVVTGTSTGVGKTVVTAAVAALARDRGATVAVVKPAQTGVDRGEPGDLAEVAPARARASTRSSRPLPRSALPGGRRPAGRRRRRCAWTTVAPRRRGTLAEPYELVLVEGAGGLLVRFADDGWTLADLARALDAPVLVVAAAGLGTLNHTALTLEVLAGRGLRLGRRRDRLLAARPRSGRAHATSPTWRPVSGRPLAGALPEGAPGLARTSSRVARHGLAPALGGVFDAADFRTSTVPATTRSERRPSQ